MGCTVDRKPTSPRHAKSANGRNRLILMRSANSPTSYVMACFPKAEGNWIDGSRGRARLPESLLT